MGIIDRIFGSKNEGERTVELDDSYTDQYDEWPYILTPKESELYNDRELYTIDKNDEVWMGKYERDIIESKKDYPKDSTYIGRYEDEDGLHNISIDFDALFRHIVLFGQAGYGKSTLMRNMMLQWINGGHGLCYIDPKGDDSKDFIEQIPSHRIDDVEYINFESGSKNKESFNLFDTLKHEGEEDYETEVEMLCSEIVDLLKKELDDWNFDINLILKTILEEQIKSDSGFNPEEILDIIYNKEKLEDFINKNNINESFSTRISDLDKSKYKPMFNLIEDIANSGEFDQINKTEGEELNISQAVLEGNILVINTSSVADYEMRGIITQMIISRIWTAIRLRGSQDSKPYFLCLDGCDSIFNRYNLNEILSQGRSYRFSVFVNSQYPSQIPKDTKLALQQVQSLFSFSLGNPSDQSEIADILGDVEARSLGKLDRFELKGRPYMNETQKSSININTPAEYPKIRDFDEFNSEDANNTN